MARTAEQRPHERDALRVLVEKVRAATGRDREIDARLMCFARGWRFVRLAGDNEYTNAYRDQEPGPVGHSKILPGTLIFYNPNPGLREHFWQQWSSNFTLYTTSVDAVLALLRQFFPKHGYRIQRENPDAKPVATLFAPPECPKALITDGRSWSRHTDGTGANDALALLSALLAQAEAETGGQHVG